MKDQEMDEARWKRIDELLDAVFDLAPDERPGFLDQACAGDEVLRKEVERLLASDERAHSFIESPAFQETSERTDTPNLLSLIRADPGRESWLRTGQLVAGRFQILSRLGKGGMGEVWHAYDLKLRVDVALKSIRLDLNRSPEDRVALTRHEIRTAREVISPNVCRIFDLVSEEDHELISMEYIDGITLSEMMEQKGPLEFRDAGDIAAQFLAGLEIIHAAGLVHRDFKPENIMITRTGRVVVMDLGIAQPSADSSGAISGTLPYMAPEQLAGEKIDVRSDIFSAGVVLAEMIHTRGAQSKSTREILWKAVREDPSKLPDGSWKAVISRAVAEKKEKRFESAAALARALEETSRRAERIEDRTPYPGLASFTGEDSDYFFGREQEVEALFQKLQQLHLTALIGPSGAGKTSFLQAGLVPVLPKEWGCAITHPGDAPMENLVQCLAPLRSTNQETIAGGVRFEDPDVAIQTLKRTREQYQEFLLIVDRFEELFTLNSSAAQSQFVEILGRAPLEANIRVLLSMRDDFLIFCKEHQLLAPVLSELTILLPLKGTALRRALIQPALKCGYRFEDESLVHEILSDVEREKGALPLMAFAASLLWEKRDREKGQLTRSAYTDIGEVRGALAQHAERTMQRIGSQQEPVVREIFRNLMTAKNTRVARDRKELLSVFSETNAAEEVLNTLIDARLLTSHENRIEITHESLISNWPRLVKWQNQDADSAQLRDELRQASQLWVQRGRLEDLLWSGTALLEFQLWRQRYPGGLTSIEEEFARAMAHRANKKRRQRQTASVTVFVLLLMIVGALTHLYREATVARIEAVSETKRAEASKMLAIGRAIPNPDPSTKLAYAIASLEFADSPHARRYALQALSEGPTAHVVEFGRHTAMEISPDGKWIAAGRLDGGLDLLANDGSAPISLQEAFKPNNYVQWKPQFSADSKFLIWTWRGDTRVVKMWSLSEKKVVRTFHLEGLTICLVRAGKAFFITDATGRLGTPMFWGSSVARMWSFDGQEPKVIGPLELGGKNWKGFDIDTGGRSIAYVKDTRVYVRSLNESGIGSEKLIGRHSAETMMVRFHPNGNQLAVVDANGELRLWSLNGDAIHPIRTFLHEGGAALPPPFFDPKGLYVFAPRDGGLARWSLTADGAEPLLFRAPDGDSSGVVDGQARLLVSQAGATLAFYDLENSHPHVFSGRGSNVRFTPDGKSLIGSNGSVILWNIPGEKTTPLQTLWTDQNSHTYAIDVDPPGKNVLAVTEHGVQIVSIPPAGNDPPLKAISPVSTFMNLDHNNVSFSPDGKSAAAIGSGIEIWDLQSGKSRMLEQSKGKFCASLKYSPDGTLFSGCDGAVYRWNLKDDTAEIIIRGKTHWVTSIAISRNGRYLAAVFSSAKKIFDFQNATCDLMLYDLNDGKASFINSHGNRVFSVAFDPTASKLISGDLDGILRVGSIAGDTPQLLLGHEEGVGDIAVHPDGTWIATADGTVRLWPMPEGRPLESLPYNELLDRLRTLTNVRAVEDPASPTGFRTKYAPYPGWKAFLRVTFCFGDHSKNIASGCRLLHQSVAS